MLNSKFVDICKLIETKKIDKRDCKILKHIKTTNLNKTARQNHTEIIAIREIQSNSKTKKTKILFYNRTRNITTLKMRQKIHCHLNRRVLLNFDILKFNYMSMHFETHFLHF